jgi:hypothetical protein
MSVSNKVGNNVNQAKDKTKEKYIALYYMRPKNSLVHFG